MESIKQQNRVVFLLLTLYLFAIPLIIFFISPYSKYEASTQVTLMFTAYIVLFAFIEAYSTLMQVVQTGKRNKIEDLRNELEKAYGPLYSLLNQEDRIEPLPEPHGQDPDDMRVHLIGTEKDTLDSIFGTYPFMFEPELLSFWQDAIQNPKGDISPQHGEYWIPVDFATMVSEEYDRRVKEYNSLIGKPDRS